MDEEAEEAESVWIEAEGAFTRQQVSSSALVKLTAVQRGA
jgi:hypothetical protein